uniref:Uncharacterized protein n=1 Tax=Myoviridae sp. ctijX18 TaxID=2825154 RepID=A0A8S5USN4_9CAUD|nr:MAG TPA: hypothetical protein [Myoviridae sp. ctijX18]DAQ61258.1 MAG TPA: hypothetical protein [Caudoviricetes sp.]
MYFTYLVCFGFKNFIHLTSLIFYPNMCWKII